MAGAVDAVNPQVMEKLRQLEAEIGKVLVGQRHLVRGLLTGLLCDAHILLEGVPGLAKTTVITTLAQCLDADFSRIQFTPDLLPSDIVGTRIFEGGTFTTKKGPIFAQIVLADEINRAPAKVQAALLEAMQERQVTIGDETFPLPAPFLVLATQNPIDQEGTYTLPEAQSDRFLLKLRVEYPAENEERQILDRALNRERPNITPVMNTDDLLAARSACDDVFIDERLRDYIVSLIRATRDPQTAGLNDLGQLLEFGASPRAVIGLAKCARAEAFLDGRGYVTPQDIKQAAPSVLRHRVRPSYEAEAEDLNADALIARLLDHIPVP